MATSVWYSAPMEERAIVFISLCAKRWGLNQWRWDRLWWTSDRQGSQSSLHWNMLWVQSGRNNKGEGHDWQYFSDTLVAFWLLSSEWSLVNVWAEKIYLLQSWYLALWMRDIEGRWLLIWTRWHQFVLSLLQVRVLWLLIGVW